MSFLIPLGFIGLIGVAALLLIYIIKPNYQNKLVSSTYVWKLSLKYHKKRIPVSKLRNILLFICQMLILLFCAFLLAQPVIAEEDVNKGYEKIAIIDASASMLTVSDGETRFERAVNGVMDLADETFNANGQFSVILADAEASFIVERATSSDRDEVFSALNKLLEGDTACTLGSADIDGAMVLAETITSVNSDSEVYFYTGKTYLNPNSVNIVDVSRGDEFNVSILDCRAIIEEGFYTFYIDLASYGRDVEVSLNCYVDPGENESGKEYTQNVFLNGDIKRTISFRTGVEEEVTMRVFEFYSVRAYVDISDNFLYDNTFTLYGGIKPTLNVQYYSANPNSFFSAALMSAANGFRERWDINIDEVRGEKIPAFSGYDLYIFENKMPADMPTDGVVVLVNPSTVPTNLSGISLGETINDGLQPLFSDRSHPLLNYMNVSDIQVSRCTELIIDASDPDIVPIMYCAGSPVVAVKNSREQKYVVMSFSINYSDMSMNKNLVTFTYNIFKYYLPCTFSDFVYDIYDTVDFYSRSGELSVTGVDLDRVFDTFPAKITLNNLGSYTTKQTLLTEKVVTESFFVKVPGKECNIVEIIDVLSAPLIKSDTGVSFRDLLAYFAAVLVTLLFVEWFLQSRTSI